MRGKRVHVYEVKIGYRFRRLGNFGKEWFVRLTDTRYCRERDLDRAMAAMSRFPVEPGREAYEDVDRLVKMALGGDDLLHLAVWNSFFRFEDADFLRSERKLFLVPVEDTA